MSAATLPAMKVSAAQATRRSGGFTLLELLVAIGLLAVVGLIGMHLFRSTVLVSQDAAKAASSMTRVDAALAELRADAWGAKSIEVTAPDSVTLEQSAGGAIHWHAGSAGDLVRDAAGTTTRWTGLPGGVAFAADGAALTVELKGTSEHPGGLAAMPSQVLLAAEDKP